MTGNYSIFLVCSNERFQNEIYFVLKINKLARRIETETRNHNFGDFHFVSCRPICQTQRHS